MMLRALSLAGTMVLCTTPAQAQFGKLKKIGADAIKDAAKDKLSTDKKPASTSTAGTAAPTARKEAATPVFTEDKVALLVISLAPQIKDAQLRDDAARANAAWVPKKKASDACIENASKTMNPMMIATNAQKNEARINAIQKQIESINKRMNAATQLKDVRSQLFLQDSSVTLTMRMAVLTYGISCQMDFTPAPILEYQAVERERMMREASGNESAEGFDPGSAVTGVMSNYEYGLLRERMALWALMQDNPALKDVGKAGTFTPEETAALTAHAADIKKMLPLFKSDALTWKTWSDLKSW
ncbi:hypothetical protein [Gemmatimonas phototrophica]|nr:hypothetical protein [Gemmatimonas phototrophica]